LTLCRLLLRLRRSVRLSCLFVLRFRLPPRSTLFPYTTLFRSNRSVRSVSTRRSVPRSGDGFPVSANGSPDVRTARSGQPRMTRRSEEHTSELQSRENLVCRLLLGKKKERAEDMAWTCEQRRA